MRMMRRAGLLGPSLPSLADIFAAMSVYSSAYNDGSSSSTVTTNYEKDKTVYYIKFGQSGSQIGKIFNDNFTYLFGTLTTAPTLSSLSTYNRASSSLRAGVALTVSIDAYEERIVDAVFSAIQETIVYGSAGNTSTTRRVDASAVTDAGLYVVAFGSEYPYFSVSSGEDLYTPIFSYTTYAGHAGKVYLYKSGNYVYFSQTGEATSNLYGARLSRLN